MRERVDRAVRFQKCGSSLKLIIILFSIKRWDEMGMYDIPAELNYVLEVTGQKKLTYIGHSMGKNLSS